MRLSLEPALQAIARRQIEALVEQGMPWSGYHWVYWASDANAEIQALQSVYGSYWPTYGSRILWLDAEDPLQKPTGAAAIGAVRARAAAVRHALPELLPGWYTNEDYWTGLVGEDPVGAGEPLWLARYDLVARATAWRPFGGWAAPTLKQYTDRAIIPSFGQVDLSVSA